PSTPIAISPRRNPSPSFTDLTEVESPNQPLTLPYNTPPPQTPNNDQLSSDITHILNHATDFYKQLWDFSPLPEDAPLYKYFPSVSESTKQALAKPFTV